MSRISPLEGEDSQFGPKPQRRARLEGVRTAAQGETVADRDDSAEHKRLTEAREQGVPWRKWRPPYLSERQWGTVREDDSENGDVRNESPEAPRVPLRRPFCFAGRPRSARGRAKAATTRPAARLCRRGDPVAVREPSEPARFPKLAKGTMVEPVSGADVEATAERRDPWQVSL
jgi:hypothetical protein